MPVEIIGFDSVPDAGEFCMGRRERARRPRQGPEARARLKAELLAKRQRGCASRTCSPASRRARSRTSTSSSRRRGRLGRGDRAGARQDPAPRGQGPRSSTPAWAASPATTSCWRGVERDHRRLQRAAQRGGEGIGRPRGRGRPYLPRHLQAARGRRAALSGMLSPEEVEETPRRGRGAAGVQGQPDRHHRRVHGHAGCHPARREGALCSATEPSSTTADRDAQALPGRRARGRPGLRVRPHPRELQRPQGRRRARGLRREGGRAHLMCAPAPRGKADGRAPVGAEAGRRRYRPR